MKLRFCIVPGYVVSPSDGGKHFVGVGALERLYNVPRSQYRVHRQAATSICNDLIHLRPKANGNYFDATERYPE